MRRWPIPLSFMLVLFFLMRLQPVDSQEAESQYDILYATFHQNRNEYQVQVVNAISGEVTEIATVGDHGSDAGWSPDGRFIYLVDTLETDARSLTLVNMETGNHQLIIDHFPPGSCSSPLWWSPDGRYLAYPAEDNRRYTVTILDTDDDSVQQLPYEGNSIYDVSWASWSAGGRYFAYGTGDDVRVWDTRGNQVILTLDTDPIQPVRWSPGADQLAYTSGAVVIFDVQDGSEQEFDAYYVDSWSPNGLYLIVVRKNYTDSFYQLLVADSVENTLRILESNNVAWSADGLFLAYEAPDMGDSSPRPAVVYDVSNSSTQQLTGTSIYPYSIRWAPAGHWLAFLESPNQQHTFDGFWIWNGDSQQYWHFTAETSDFIQEVPLQWSPDGRYLAVKTRDSIVVFDHQEETLHDIAETHGYASYPRWSPDGRYLAFSTMGGAYIADMRDFRTHRLMNASETNRRFLGWRGSNQHDSLMFCGSG